VTRIEHHNYTINNTQTSSLKSLQNHMVWPSQKPKVNTSLRSKSKVHMQDN